MLRFQTSSHRVTSPSLNDLLPENNYNVEEIKEISLAPGTELKPLSLILLPTGEEITTFHGQKSYRGVLLPAKKKVPVDQKRDCGTVGKKNKNSLVEKRILDDSEDNFESILLTKFDLKNRKRAYSLFLPDNKEKCDEYWRLGFGVILKSDANSHKSKVCQGEAKERSDKRIEIREEENSNGYHLTEVTMELGDQRIIPTQLLVR